jgi:hypothetical protein
MLLTMRKFSSLKAKIDKELLQRYFVAVVLTTRQSILNPTRSKITKSQFDIF